MAKTRCKDPVSSETVRPVATGMKDKWGDSREGTSLSVTSEGEVGGGKSVPQRVFEAPQCGSAGRKGGTTLRRSEARCLRVAFATMTGLGSFVNAGGVKR